MRTKHALAILSSALFLSPQGALLAQVAPDSLRQSESLQQQIRGRTSEVAGSIKTIISEFQRNGLGDAEEVHTLVAISGVLDKLTAEEMSRVVDLLQQARSGEDAGAARRNVTDAYTSQKVIIAQLGQLLIEYERQQELYRLSQQIETLAERQDGNLKAVIRLAREAGRTTPSQYTAEQQMSFEVQKNEQAALKQEIAQAIQKIETLAETADGETARRLKDAVRQARQKNLEQLAGAAEEDLNTGNLFRATSNEQATRDRLRDLSREIAPPKDTLTALRDAAEDVEKAIEEQKRTIEQTRQLPTDKPEVAEAEQRQADIVDDTETIRKDLNNVAPKTVEELARAQKEMQLARSRLNQKKPDEAVKNQEEALKTLETARDQLQKEIAKIEEDQQFPQDRLEALKHLKDKTAELRKEQEELTQKAETQNKPAPELAERQQELKDQAQNLQQKASLQSSEAADDLGDAARQMDRAANTPQPPTRQQQQQQATEALRQAEKKLGDEIAQLEKAQEQLAQLQESRQDVGELLEQQRGLETETAKVALQQQNQQQPAPTPPQLGQQQEQLAQRAQEAQRQMADAPQAAQAMQQAQRNMETAKGNLEKSAPAEARPPQQEAIAQLEKTRDALDSRIADLQEQLGQQAPSPSLEQALSQLEQAQERIAEAQGNMPGQMQKGSEQLREAQQSVSQAMEQSNLPASAQQAMREAQKSLSEATAQAGAQQADPARQAASSAQQQLAQAQAAMAMAMQGMTPGQPMPGMPSPGPGDENMMSQGDGNRQGESQGVSGQTARGGANGHNAEFLGLPERDRAALQQSQAEKYPEEYGTMIEQYLRNLSQQPAAEAR